MASLYLLALVAAARLPAADRDVLPPGPREDAAALARFAAHCGRLARRNAVTRTICNTLPHYRSPAVRVHYADQRSGDDLLVRVIRRATARARVVGGRAVVALPFTCFPYEVEVRREDPDGGEPVRCFTLIGKALPSAHPAATDNPVANEIFGFPLVEPARPADVFGAVRDGRATFAGPLRRPFLFSGGGWRLPPLLPLSAVGEDPACPLVPGAEYAVTLREFGIYRNSGGMLGIWQERV